MASDDPAVAECLGGVVAVVVTWNRREVLTRCLDAVLGQTHRPSRVVIVDNDSDDGTASVLAERYADLPNVQIVRTVENIGGAGGFALGLEFALGGAGETAWLLDDDTVPTPGALEALVGARTAYQQSTGTTPVLVASRAVWTDGREHPMNTPRRKPGASAAETSAAAAVGCVAIRTASFVSILVDLERTREVGLPEAGFFLWNDDFEFTARLARGRRALYCRASTVVHETKKFGGTDADPGPRFHLEVRNKVWTFGRSRGLSAPEKVLYGGATARRWARTIWRSTDRPTLLRGLGQGLRAGLTGAPAPTSVVLTEALGAGAETGAGARQMTPRREDGFAVLMSVYARDRADFFEDAFRSVTVDQTLPPDQVVLVVDGPLPPALRARVEAVVSASSVPVTLVRLPVNGGLGPALRAGLARCDHEIVARMDADDVSLPTRFEIQVPLVRSGLDVVGSALLEFADDPAVISRRRDVHTDPSRIQAGARFRQTLNHPSVVFRASAVDAAGGYQDLPSLEDYLLFARMIHRGARVGNVAEPLVLYRVGAGSYARRGGMRLLRSELALQREFRRAGFTTRTQWVRNLAVRGGYRVAPERLRKAGYGTFFARRERERPGDPSGGVSIRPTWRGEPPQRVQGL